MMMRNYGEATKIFVNCLLYIQRTKNLQQQHQQQKKNFQYDVVSFLPVSLGKKKKTPNGKLFENRILMQIEAINQGKMVVEIC